MSTASTNSEEPMEVYVVTETWEPEDFSAVKGTNNRIVASFRSLEAAKSYAEHYATDIAKVTALSQVKGCSDLGEVLEKYTEEYDTIAFAKPWKSEDELLWRIDWGNYTEITIETVEVDDAFDEEAAPNKFPIPLGYAKNPR